MVIAVPHGVILEHELTGERGHSASVSVPASSASASAPCSSRTASASARRLILVDASLPARSTAGMVLVDMTASPGMGQARPFGGGHHLVCLDDDILSD